MSYMPFFMNFLMIQVISSTNENEISLILVISFIEKMKKTVLAGFY